MLAEDSAPRILKGIAIVWLSVSLGFVVALVAGAFSVYAEYFIWVAWSPVISIWWTRRRQFGS